MARPADIFVASSAGLLLALLGLLLLHPLADAPRRQARQELERQLVAGLGLTDLCLSTEARYLRHPSQADLWTAFQDHPRGRDHFPGGSLLPPPPGLWAGAPEARP